MLAWAQREVAGVLRAVLTTVNRLTTSASTTVTSSGTIDGTTDVTLADAAAGAIVLTLPSPAAWIRRIRVVKVDASANTVTVAGAAAGSTVLAAQWDVLEVVCDGEDFY